MQPRASSARPTANVLQPSPGNSRAQHREAAHLFQFSSQVRVDTAITSLFLFPAQSHEILKLGFLEGWASASRLAGER